jgi:hypothetical protein
MLLGTTLEKLIVYERVDSRFQVIVILFHFSLILQLVLTNQVFVLPQRFQASIFAV